MDIIGAALRGGQKYAEAKSKGLEEKKSFTKEQYLQQIEDMRARNFAQFQSGLRREEADIKHGYRMDEKDKALESQKGLLDYEWKNKPKEPKERETMLIEDERGQRLIYKDTGEQVGPEYGPKPRSSKDKSPEDEKEKWIREYTSKRMLNLDSFSNQQPDIEKIREEAELIYNGPVDITPEEIFKYAEITSQKILESDPDEWEEMLKKLQVTNPLLYPQVSDIVMSRMEEIETEKKNTSQQKQPIMGPAQIGRKIPGALIDFKNRFNKYEEDDPYTQQFLD